MESIEHLYAMYAQTVYKYLFSITQNADLSEELTQETFYQATKTIHHFRGDCKISVWLCQIAKRAWYKELSKSKKMQTRSMDESESLVHPGHNLENSVLQNEDKLAMFRMLHRLDEKTKEVMYLRLSGELSFSEIGDILGQSETWARVTFYRGKQKMVKEREQNG
ncbi:RNA polymerase sigma factor [Paenibacillus sp. SYP-B4298]|uniref:RNA polymerase sigma factor n=1 Tax=Paenibacillus sp. SYP-B4298 TaxID=2996034 RepID=UPI0022DE7902|nr:sigma-70 family RNA polymerase sigma factor [Paenibacillus sp. SYP-B4298]